MLTPVGKNVLLAVLSTTIAAAAFMAGYEAHQSAKYDRWRSAYRENGDWYDQLTVASDNPILMWEYRPNGEYRALKLKTNKYGFRQHDNVSLKKAEGALRVAFIGDSVTLGIKVENRESFVSQFEVFSKDLYPGLNVEGLNFGVDGYNTIQIEELLKTKVLQFSPDHVVYVMCLNDFDFEEASGNKILYFKKPKSFFIQRATNMYMRLFYDGKDYHAYHLEKNKEAVFHSILNMKDMLEKRGIRFSVVVVPIFNGSITIDMITVKKSNNFDSFEEYPVNEIHEKIANTLNGHDINFIDLLEEFRKQGKPPSFYAHDVWHPNAKGHRLIAHAMAKAVLAP